MNFKILFACFPPYYLFSCDDDHKSDAIQSGEVILIDSLPGACPYLIRQELYNESAHQPTINNLVYEK